MRAGRRLAGALERARALGPYDMVFYNAGTDVLDGDPLGRLGVSRDGIIKRDQVGKGIYSAPVDITNTDPSTILMQMVWETSLTLSSPIVQCLSGGYSRESASVVVDALVALVKRFGLCRMQGELAPFANSKADT